MVLEHPSEEDRDDVAQVESHGSQREDGVGRNGACEVKQPRKDGDKGSQEDSAEGGVGHLGVVAEITSIGESCNGLI